MRKESDRDNPYPWPMVVGRFFLHKGCTKIVFAIASREGIWMGYDHLIVLRVFSLQNEQTWQSTVIYIVFYRILMGMLDPACCSRNLCYIEKSSDDDDSDPLIIWITPHNSETRETRHDTQDSLSKIWCRAGNSPSQIIKPQYYKEWQV